MSSVTPGRETDAAVARALGWELRRIGRGVPPGCEGMKHPVAYPHYSTAESDAIAALEAVKKVRPSDNYWLIECIGCEYVVSIGRSFANTFDGRGPDLPTAACSAILAWHAAKGGK